MRLIRFADKGNERPGIWLPVGRRIAASGERGQCGGEDLGTLSERVVAFYSNNHRKP